ncbi:MAG: energy transducer TonB [Labilithrix sp.]|nr:energy transducer TonB [Labilithrix sp.]
MRGVRRGRGAAAPQPAPGPAAPAPGPAAPAGVPVAPPRLLSDPDVPYPDGATGDATVIVVLVVGEDGAVRSASPEGADEPFLSAAAAAARAWRFDPATRGGQPVASRVKLAITFRAPVVEEVA